MNSKNFIILILCFSVISNVCVGDLIVRYLTGQVESGTHKISPFGRNDNIFCSGTMVESDVKYNDVFTVL